jgi:hypothetical protein
MWVKNSENGDLGRSSVFSTHSVQYSHPDVLPYQYPSVARERKRGGGAASGDTTACQSRGGTTVIEVHVVLAKEGSAGPWTLEQIVNTCK